MNVTNVVESFKINKLLSVYKAGVFETLSINLGCRGYIPSKEWINKFKEYYHLRGYIGNISYFISGNCFIFVFKGIDVPSDLILQFFKNISGLVSTVNVRLCDLKEVHINENINRDFVYSFVDELLDEFNYFYPDSEKIKLS